MFENGKEMLQILEGNNFIRPTFDERMKLPEILEAAKDAEDDLDLDEAIDEADDEIKTKKLLKPASKKDSKDDDLEGLDDDVKAPEKQIKAEAVNKAGISIKILLKVWSRILDKMSANINMEAINNSKGDIKQLGVMFKDKTYYEVFKIINDTHRAVAESFSDSGKNSKYFDIFADFLKEVEKYTPKFKKAYTKKKDNLAKCVYISAVMYLVEMSTILAATTVHIFNKGSKSFDKLIEDTKDYVAVFNAAENFFKADGSDVGKFMTQDVAISEAAIAEWYNNVDDLSALDKSLIDISESLNPERQNAVGLAHIAKLLKYGLSVTMYKLFSVMRYVIYLLYYQKYNFQKKITLIASSLDLINNDGDNNVKSEKRNLATQSSIEYRADVIIASNKTTVDIATNDEKGATVQF